MKERPKPRVTLVLPKNPPPKPKPKPNWPPVIKIPDDVFAHASGPASE